jgi:hypothetical protein
VDVKVSRVKTTRTEETKKKGVTSLSMPREGFEPTSNPNPLNTVILPSEISEVTSFVHRGLFRLAVEFWYEYSAVIQFRNRSCAISEFQPP